MFISLGFTCVFNNYDVSHNWNSEDVLNQKEETCYRDKLVDDCTLLRIHGKSFIDYHKYQESIANNFNNYCKDYANYCLIRLVIIGFKIYLGEVEFIFDMCLHQELYLSTVNAFLLHSTKMKLVISFVTMTQNISKEVLPLIELSNIT